MDYLDALRAQFMGLHKRADSAVTDITDLRRRVKRLESDAGFEPPPPVPTPPPPPTLPPPPAPTPDPPPVIPPVLPPPGEPPVAGDPWTFRWASMSLAQQKADAIARIPLEPAGTRAVIVGTTDVNGGSGTYAFADETRSPVWQWAYNAHLQNAEPDVHMTFDNVHMGTPVEFAATGLKWFARLWNLHTLSIRKCSVVGRFHEGRQIPSEHAFYAEHWGDVLVEDALFKDLGGHGCYFPHREFAHGTAPSSNRAFPEPATITLRNVSHVDTDMDASRGSHAATFFDNGSVEHPGSIVLEDCAFALGWDWERGQNSGTRYPVGANLTYAPVRSCGVMVAHQFQQFPTQPGEWALAGITLRRCAATQTQANHAFMDLRGARDYWIEDCFFQSRAGRNPYLNVGAYGGGDARIPAPASVTVRNVISDGVRLRVHLSPTEHLIFDLPGRGQSFTWTPENGGVYAAA